MEENIFKYKYKTSDLDAVIEKRRKGIVPLIPEDMEAEVELREREIALTIRDEFGDDDISEEETMELVKKHNALLEAQIEKERRNTHADEFITLDISEEEKQQMEELCSVSYVRVLPGSVYHMADEEIYDSKERKEIVDRLKKVGNMYYNPDDWRNAMQILIDAWKYSYDHDYPGIPEQLKANRIHLNRQMPKLMLNYTTIVNDPKMLMGILNGEIKCMDKDEASSALYKHVRPKDSEVKGVRFSEIGGRVLSKVENDYETYLARMGDNNSIMLHANKIRSTIYDRFSIDLLTGKAKKNEKNFKDEFGNDVSFDFCVPGSGRKAYNLVHKVKEKGVADFANDIMKANNNKLTQNISGSMMNDFAKSFNKTSWNRNNQYTTESADPQLNQDAFVVQQEQALLQTMRMFNPNK